MTPNATRAAFGGQRDDARGSVEGAMDVKELLVATQEHLARAHERAQAVVLPPSENATAGAVKTPMCYRAVAAVRSGG